MRFLFEQIERIAVSSKIDNDIETIYLINLDVMIFFFFFIVDRFVHSRSILRSAYFLLSSFVRTDLASSPASSNKSLPSLKQTIKYVSMDFNFRRFFTFRLLYVPVSSKPRRGLFLQFVFTNVSLFRIRKESKLPFLRWLHYGE